MCLLIFFTTCVWNNSHSKKKNHMSWKSVQLEPSCSMRTDGLTDWLTDRLTDRTELIVAFRNFANASKKRSKFCSTCNSISIYSCIKYPSIKCWDYTKHRLTLYQVNADKCTQILWNHHFINTIHNFSRFQPLMGHLQDWDILEFV